MYKRQFSPLPILGVALFLSIGLSFFIKPKPYFFEREHIKEMGEDVKEQSEDGIINISTKLSSSIKYIDTDNLKKVNIYCSCSGSKVYFDSAKMDGNEAIVNIEASCSGIESVSDTHLDVYKRQLKTLILLYFREKTWYNIDVNLINRGEHYGRSNKI